MSDLSETPAGKLSPIVFACLEEQLDWVGSLAEISLAHAQYRVKFSQPDFPIIDWGGINKLIGYLLGMASGNVGSIRAFMADKKLLAEEE